MIIKSGHGKGKAVLSCRSKYWSSKKKMKRNIDTWRYWKSHMENPNLFDSKLKQKADTSKGCEAPKEKQTCQVQLKSVMESQIAEKETEFLFISLAESVHRLKYFTRRTPLYFKSLLVGWNFSFSKNNNNNQTLMKIFPNITFSALISLEFV